MLDILDTNGKVVAVLLDNGVVVKKSDKENKDLDKLIEKKLEDLAKNPKKRAKGN